MLVLPVPGGPPQDHRRQLARRDHAADRAVGTGEMLLADDLGERRGPLSVGQRGVLGRDRGGLGGQVGGEKVGHGRQDRRPAERMRPPLPLSFQSLGEGSRILVVAPLQTILLRYIFDASHKGEIFCECMLKGAPAGRAKVAADSTSGRAGFISSSAGRRVAAGADAAAGVAMMTGPGEDAGCSGRASFASCS